MADWQRTKTCGELRADDAGVQVTLNGWVHSIRSHGDLVFVDLRDRTGIVQVRADASSSTEVLEALASVKNEYVLCVKGEVQMRAPGMANPKLATGDIEIQALDVQVLNACRQPLPFQLNDENQMSLVNEELRLRYRYLDLRRPRMFEMLRLRHQVIAAMRRFLDSHGFLEVETPIFTRSTPEGARDYLVPYRLSPGLFYALPQSPQQYKQLLMVAGIERYYQIARCFRDEAQRADRQPEFTQLDMEMSFVTQEDVLRITEEMTVAVVQECSSKRLGATPFTRLTYDDAMLRYGTDKPDLRFGLEIADLSDCLRETTFGVFRDALASGGVVRCVRYPGGSGLSRRETDNLARMAKEWGAKGLAHLAVDEPEGPDSSPTLRGPIAKFVTDAERAAVLRTSEASPGDLLLIVADAAPVAANVLGRLRQEIGRRLGLVSPDVLHFCWITDFPLVQWNAEENRWDAEHHPFTMPHEEDLPYLDTDPVRVRAQCYDIVCNGVEWGSGSIRISRADIQAKVFALLGMSEKVQRERFGHMLDAFAYGAPPHGGVAPGIDRLIMLLTDTDNIREVMAFPKIGGGNDPLMGAPSVVDDAQLRELGLQIVKPKT